MKKIMIALLSVYILSIFSASAFAADQSFAFNLPNTGTTYRVYTGASNVKVYSGDSATVKVTSNNTPGWGMAFCMKHWNGYDQTGNPDYQIDTVTSPAYWVSGTGTVNPDYLSGHNVTGRAYYVAARIDSDLTGTYSSAGMFNSDET